MRIILLLIHLLIFSNLFGQPKSDLKRDYTWSFSQRGSQDSFRLGAKFVFNKNDSLQVLKDSFLSDIAWGNSSICDESGNLILYSNGCNIYGSDNQIIENGAQINKGYYLDTHCPDGAIIPNGILFLPLGIDTFFLIYQRKVFNSNASYFEYDILYYSEVVKSPDGNYKVTLKDQLLMDDVFMLGGNLAACRHANGKDWWILSSKANSNLKYKRLITSDGILSQNSQPIGGEVFRSESISGATQFSPNGEKFAIYNTDTDIHIYDFDRNTGWLSNPIDIPIKDYSDIVDAAGIAFSPNSRFLYISSTNHIYQFDLMANDVSKSKEIVAIYNGWRDDIGLTAKFTYAQLGPDGKIYVGAPGNRGVWHVINSPNEKGIACSVQQQAFRTEEWLHSRAIPNFPNFRLGPLKGNIGDSLNIPSWLTIEGHPYDQLTCLDSKTHFEVTAFGYPLSYQWQINQAGDWVDLSDDALFSGVKQHYLTISKTDSTMSGWQFRCIIQTDIEKDTSRLATLNVSSSRNVIADFEAIINEDTIRLKNQSENGIYFQWHYGDLSYLDSVESPDYYVYQPSSYDSTYQVELLVQNECSHAWKRDSIDINIPKFELDFRLKIDSMCSEPPIAYFEDVSINKHRIKSRIWGTNSGVILDFNGDSSCVKMRFLFRSTYEISLNACDEFRCDSLVQSDLVRVYGPIYRWPTDRPIIHQTDGKKYSLNCVCPQADTVTWSFDSGEIIGTTDPMNYEFEKDSTYVIIMEASNPCETVRDTSIVNVITSNLTNLRSKTQKVRIFPNPAFNYFTVFFSSPLDDDSVLILYNSLGQKVSSHEIEAGLVNQKIQVKKYLSGNYAYSIFSSSGVMLDNGWIFFNK